MNVGCDVPERRGGDAAADGQGSLLLGTEGLRPGGGGDHEEGRLAQVAPNLNL